MAERRHTTRFRFWLWLVRVIGVIVPRRLRADWRQEWEAELQYRERLLAEWDQLNWRTKLDLLWHSAGAFADALWLQPKRLEDEMFQDLRYGTRMLLKDRGFTCVAALTLALGIGANSAIFSLLDVLLLKSLPVREPEKLVLFGKGEDMGVTNDFPNGSWQLFSWPFYQELRQRNEVFSDVTALLSLSWGVHGSVNVNGAGGEAEQLNVQLVSGTYFTVLGVPAGMGRTFTEADDRTPGGHPVAVVSHAWWERRLGGDPAAVGKTITIDQTAYTIIGVTPKEFFGTTVGQVPDLWVPLAMEPQMPPAHWNGRHNKEFQSLYLIARLKNGVSVQQASAAVNLLFKQSLQERAGAQASAERLRDIERAGIELTPAGKGLSELRRQFSLSLRILMAVVGVVLLIACANVANLLLARAAARQKEFAVRLAVGAGRVRLIRQLLTESVLLAGLGGVAGVALAWWGSRLLLLMASDGSESLPLDVSPNTRILGFTLLASLLSAIIFGTAPALRAARIELNPTLKGGTGAAQAASQSPLGKALVVAQVALSLVLLIGAGLFVRTLINLQNLPTGFNQQNVMLFQIDTATTGYKGAQFAPLLREVEEKVKAVPGVEAASFSFFIFNQGQWTSKAFTREQTPPEGQSRVVRNNVVGQDYFAAMGIPLVLGRGFNSQDTDKSQQVAVISETMAQRFFPNRSPLGQRFGINGPESSNQVEIIGVVKDARYGSLKEELRPMAYYPHAQHPQPLGNLVVRFSGASEAVITSVRQAIRQVNRNLPIDEVVSLSDHIGRSLTQQKLVARLASFFGLLALLLACVGLYGVLSCAVARRAGEIGIRMALGAQSGDVLWLVLREALALVLVGVVIGLAASLAATRTASSLLFGLKPNDPLTITLAALLLVSVAALAGYLPARRAARVDPLVALRDE
ncbi:MAG TPA: ABC transporter permease [Blastocatellia bacterium]|nr:ABC transporter permease [Blastocatellia bacterium]